MKNKRHSIEEVVKACWNASGGQVVLLPAQSKIPCGYWKGKHIPLDTLLDHVRNRANYGIQTGSLSGFDVLDVDRPDLHTELVDRLKAIAPWTETGRGMHFWFLHNPRVEKNKTNAVTGIDVKTSGGYVVGPGSVHTNGKTYELHGTLADSPDWPLDLLDLLYPTQKTTISLSDKPVVTRNDFDKHQPFPSPYLAGALKRAISLVRETPVGERNATLNRETFSLAGLAHAGLDRAQVEQELVAAAVESGLPLHEAQSTFCSAWDKGILSPRIGKDSNAQGEYPANRPHGTTVNPSDNDTERADVDVSQTFRLGSPLEFQANSIEAETPQGYITSDGETFTLDERHCVHTNNTSFDVFQGTRAVQAYNRYAMKAAAEGTRHCEPAPLFNHGNIMVHMTPDRRKLRPTSRALYDTVLDGKACKWYSIAPQKDQDNAPPGFFAVKKSIPRSYVSQGSMSTLLESSDGLPHINKIVTSPVFLPDGPLTREPGYYANPGIWYEPSDDFKKLEIISVEDALRVLLEDFLVDFPFTEQADRANLIAMQLLMFMRDMIEGTTPLFVVEAPTPGTGKSLLVECCAIIAAGRKVAPCAFGNDDEELRKHLTACLLDGPQMVLFDNLPAKRVIDRPSLAAVLTTTTWSDRILCRSETVTLPTSCVWLATGNNLHWSEELARRIVRVRLVPTQEQPWHRTGFRHSNLARWVIENRPLLAASCISIIQAWIESGCPRSDVRLGSFDEFASTMGGILTFAGVEGFLDNANDFMDQASPDAALWGRAYAIWAENIGSEWATAKELLEILQQKSPDLLDEILYTVSPKSLGRQLATKIDRIHGRYRLVSRLSGGNRQYSLQETHVTENVTQNPSEAADETDDEELF